jgi:hypothetical protein
MLVERQIKAAEAGSKRGRRLARILLPNCNGRLLSWRIPPEAGDSRGTQIGCDFGR